MNISGYGLTSVPPPGESVQRNDMMEAENAEKKRG